MVIIGKKSIGSKVFNILLLLFLTGFVIAIIYPFLNLISLSFSEEGPVLRGEISFFPKGFTLVAYKEVFTNKAIWGAYGNSIFVAGVGCFLSLIFTSFAAYPLAFSNFIGKKVISVMIVITLWFNAGMIPAFLVMKSVGLIDSLWALILGALMNAFNILILKSFFMSIPDSLIESAKMDGANDFRILFGIVLPLSKAALATIALWVIVGHWNDFFNPLIYLNSYKNFTLQIVLKDIVLANSAIMYGIDNRDNTMSAIPDQVKNAVLLVSMVPMLAIYPFLQKYFVKGIMLGAVKG